MTLRTKLIVAFLLLAVIPLVVVTVYSYASSIEALHRTVERESGAVAEQMGDRMELVASDLDRHVEGLGRLPFRSLTEGDAGSDRLAGDFVTGLLQEMGDSAMLVDALEFVPAAPPAEGAVVVASGPPGTPRAVAPPSAVSPVVIHLSPMLFHEKKLQEIEVLAEKAGIARGEGEMMLLPREVLEARVEIDTDEPLPAELFQSLMQIGLEIGEQGEAGEMENIDELVRSIEERTQIYAERVEASAREQKRRQREMQHEVEKLKIDERRIAERGAEERKQKRWTWKREFATSVEREGEVVGTVKARINAQQVLHSVFERVDHTEGEIPFAVDEAGIVYTLDEEDKEFLDDLKLASLAGARGEPAQGRVVGDWVIATREAPSLGLVFGMARPVGESLDEIRGATARNLGYGLAVVGLAMLGIVPLSGRMTRDLSELSSGAARLADGDLESRVPVRSRDEIGKLAVAFNSMTDDLRRNQEQLVKQERLSKELEMCRQIQNELLPRSGSSFPFAQVNGVSIPAREVGGDFFNYFPLPGGDVAIVMGDVAGKGVPAALLMANLQATLKARMPQERDLAELARWLDAEIDQNTPSEAYVTLFIGVLDHERLTLRCVNAGHNPQYVVRAAGGVERLEAGGRPLGLLPGGDYTARALDLSPDDFLFLFTDGLTEAENASGEEFGAKRLEQILIEAREDNPDRLLARVEEVVHEYRGGTVAADDATMLALKVGAPARVSLPETPSAV